MARDSEVWIRLRGGQEEKREEKTVAERDRAGSIGWERVRTDEDGVGLREETPAEGEVGEEEEDDKGPQETIQHPPNGSSKTKKRTKGPV